MPIKIYLIAAALLSLSVITTGQTPARLDKSPCAVPIPDGVKVDCFILTVPESRAKPTSRIVRLPIVIVKSTAVSPAPDPIVYTAGGPGVGSLGMVRGAANLVPYTAKRDFIVFEQRGTLQSDPSLQCPEVVEALHANFASSRSPKAEHTAEAAAAKRCRDRLTGSGIDLAAYNSVESATDLDDLRKLLGVERWNLYGISYSTRLMVNYYRDHPAAVRSIILDSVLPIDKNWDEDGAANITSALGRIFTACSADKDCSARYPLLEQMFYETAAALDKSPATVEIEAEGKKRSYTLYGRHFVDLVYNLLEGNGSLQWIPFTVKATHDRNFDPLKRYAEQQTTSSGFIWGMRYSVWCGEEIPFESPKKIARAWKRDKRLRGFSSQASMPEVCKEWNVPAAKPIENLPVKIDVPVLAFGGEFDPDTPFVWSEGVAGWSSHGYFFKVPSTTHGAMNRKCTFVDIPIAFLNDPTERPDGSCLKSVPAIVFK